MKYRLVDILACPYDKKFPLELYVFKVEKYEKREVKLIREPMCEKYCAYRGKPVEELESAPPCRECMKYEVVEGLFYCDICGRWYPIVDEIPIFLPDEIRGKRKKDDLEFLEKHKDEIPDKILKEGKPWSLGSST